MAIRLSGYKMERAKKKRPGIHSKCKTSNHKGSKHYKKKYRGQGR
jgi:hypothetical protein|tara:strand:- start:287 stop:421 length:135 start_codon:yes stop_codon:yes gene_type:complete